MRAVVRAGHRTDLLGPGAIRLRDGRERVDDLVREELVERPQRPERRHDPGRDRELCVTDPIFTVTGMTVKVT